MEANMGDPQELRNLARKCRQLAETSIDPGVIEHLRRWAAELADEADAIERDEDAGRPASNR